MRIINALLSASLVLIFSFSQALAATTQDFDNPGTPWVGANIPGLPGHPQSAPPPVVMGPDAFSTGNYLRLKDTTIRTFNNVGFDLTDPGAYNRIVADFDFRITCRGNRIGFGPGGFNGCADGFAIVLLDTGVFGTSGVAPVINDNAQTGFPVVIPSSSIGAGFRVFDPGFGSFPKNDVRLVFNNGGIQGTLIDRNTFDLATGTQGVPGVFHHAQLELILGGATPHATLTLTHGLTAAVITPLLNVDLSSVVIGGIPVAPFESRVAFGVRSGDAGIAVDLDNIEVQYLDPAVSGTPIGGGGRVDRGACTITGDPSASVTPTGARHRLSAQSVARSPRQVKMNSVVCPFVLNTSGMLPVNFANRVRCSLVQADTGGMASVHASLGLFDQFGNVLDTDSYSKLVSTTLAENTQGHINEQVRVRATLPAGSYSWRSNFNVVADARGDGGARTFCDNTFEYEITGGEDPVDPFGDEPRILKRLSSGPDADGDMEIDRVVEVEQTESTAYDFDITYRNLNGPDVLIVDTLPAEWIVTEIESMPVDVDECGESASVTNAFGSVDVFKGGKLGKKCQSATHIEWTPDPDGGSINVAAMTRQSPGKNNVKYAPGSCGPFSINDGASVFELDPATGEPRRDPTTGELLLPILESSALFLAAVEDLDGTVGVIADGSGDEDQDGLTDGDEVFALGTDPCLADSDGDGFNDDVDQCPIEGLPNIAAGEVLGNDGCIIFPPSPP